MSRESSCNVAAHRRALEATIALLAGAGGLVDLHDAFVQGLEGVGGALVGLAGGVHDDFLLAVAIHVVHGVALGAGAADVAVEVFEAGDGLFGFFPIAANIRPPTL